MINKSASSRRVITAFLEKMSVDIESRIEEFFKENPKPADDQVHALAEDLGIDKHKFEEKVYEMLAKRLKTAKEEGSDGFVVDIETETKGNDNFRKVLYTGKHSQLVLMSLKPNEDIGDEVHKTLDQFFRVDDGSGKVIINGKDHAIKNGSAFIIPSDTEHNIIAGDSGLKLYSIYSPPNHEDGTIHKTKEEAESDNEKFDGKTTEGK